MVTGRDLGKTRLRPVPVRSGVLLGGRGQHGGDRPAHGLRGRWLFDIGTPTEQLWIALAAYATYVINAAQFLLKLRAARRDEAAGERRQRALAGSHRVSDPVLARDCNPTPAVTLERGQRAVFCGLTSIVWLHRKMQDAFFLVVGSRTCAHLLQSAAGVMIFAEPRFATAILQDRIWPAWPTATRSSTASSPRSSRGARDPHPVPGRLLPLGSHQARPAYGGKTPAAALRGPAAPGGLHRQRHRNHLHPGRGQLPGGTGGTRNAEASAPGERRLLVAGTLSDVVEDQFDACSTNWASVPWPFLPARRAADTPRVGPGTRLLLAQPWLTETVAALTQPRRQPARAPFPLGAEGTRAWLQAAAQAFGCRPGASSTRSWPRPWIAPGAPSAAQRETLAGRSIAFLPDSQLEVPLARFLQRECGMQVTAWRRPSTTRSSWPRSSPSRSARTYHRGRRRREAPRCRARQRPGPHGLRPRASPTRWRPRDCARSGPSS
jgi:light-independent protochlorophyllide reductase subunit N